MSRVLVTGASGFIGSRVLPLLLDAGHEVAAVSRHPEPDPGPEGVEWLEADLMDGRSVAPMVHKANATHLVHLAWYTEPGELWTSWENGRWVDASLRLWGAFAAGGGRRAVFAGSCAEYAWDGTKPLSEQSTPVEPATAYGIAKDKLRRTVEADATPGGIEVAWARIFFAYGPGDHAGLVPSVAEALAEGRPAKTTDGEQRRDFVHVDDVAAALAALVGAELTGPVNIGSGEAPKVKDVAVRLGELAGHPELIQLGEIPRRERDEPDLVVADTSRARDELGWEAKIDLERGLTETLESLRG